MLLQHWLKDDARTLWLRSACAWAHGCACRVKGAMRELSRVAAGGDILVRRSVASMLARSLLHHSLLSESDEAASERAPQGKTRSRDLSTGESSPRDAVRQIVCFGS
eukprot:372707-Rhodomonas_salina.1